MSRGKPEFWLLNVSILNCSCKCCCAQIPCPMWKITHSWYAGGLLNLKPRLHICSYCPVPSATDRNSLRIKSELVQCSRKVFICYALKFTGLINLAECFQCCPEDMHACKKSTVGFQEACTPSKRASKQRGSPGTFFHLDDAKYVCTLMPFKQENYRRGWLWGACVFV